jgi:DNA (cytosine-5)-methyltransferase 1
VLLFRVDEQHIPFHERIGHVFNRERSRSLHHDVKLILLVGGLVVLTAWSEDDHGHGAVLEYPPIKVRKRTGPRNVGDVIRKLCAPAFFSRELQTKDIPVHANHWTMRPKSDRFSQLPSAWRATRSFRLTKWDAPSPTIAFGHREIHVHPSCTRRLSIYEAMLLQGFPNAFILKGTLSDQVEQISNAVPPPLALSIAQGIRRAVLGVQP